MTWINENRHTHLSLFFSVFLDCYFLAGSWRGYWCLSQLNASTLSLWGKVHETLIDENGIQLSTGASVTFLTHSKY